MAKIISLLAGILIPSTCCVLLLSPTTNALTFCAQSLGVLQCNSILKPPVVSTEPQVKEEAAQDWVPFQIQITREGGPGTTLLPDVDTNWEPSDPTLCFSNLLDSS